MECNKGFSSSYMLLKPEEVKFFDLIHIVFSSDTEKRKFVDSAEAKEESFGRRWLIFVSSVAQKVLAFSSKPLSRVGAAIEMWLNLLSSNRNFGRLLLNVFAGKVVIPDKTSSSFISFSGNYDKRTELDRNIKHGDPNYFAALSVMASKAAYENKAYLNSIVKDHWQMEFLGFYDFWNDFQDKATTQAFLFRDKNGDHDTIVVAFRGTEPFEADAWRTNIDISWYEFAGIGKIHGGFMKALGLQKNVGWPMAVKEDDNRPAPLAYYAIREMLRGIISQNKQSKYILTGHSLGGALAILFPAILAFHDEKLLLERLEGIYTFGQPRVGDESFGVFMERKLQQNAIAYYRFVYGNDMVPRLPYDDSALMFNHFGTCIYYDRHYHGQVVPEEPNKNYFSPIKAIPKIYNAFLELVRSFTIFHSKGPEYREGWLLRAIRFAGLAVPGIPPHCIQDYVNCTRLGTADLFLQPREARNNRKSI